MRLGYNKSKIDDFKINENFFTIKCRNNGQALRFGANFIR